MNPYYSRDGIVIYHGETMDVLRCLPTASASAVFADPPYSSGGLMRNDRQADPSAKYRGWSQGDDGKSIAPRKDTGTFSGDGRDQRSYAYWCALWLSQCARIAQSGAQLFHCTDWRQLPTSADAIQAGGWIWRGLITWDKGIGRPMKGRFRNHLEYVVWGSNGPMPRPKDVYPSTLIRRTPPTSGARVHVTQKPVELVTDLLVVADEGTLLDPFMGSGTSLVAAQALGRPAIGVEIEERYCEIAAKRLEQEVLGL